LTFFFIKSVNNPYLKQLAILVSMLYEILYSSVAIQKFSADGIQSLLSQCFENNKENDITGCMIYKKREFIQVIEGEKKHVKALFEKIKHDKRHTKVQIIWEGETKQRSFNQWLMGFYNFDELNIAEIQGFADILQKEIKEAPKTDHESIASRLFTLMSEDIRKAK